jgi:prevent-host-death family protein
MFPDHVSFVKEVLISEFKAKCVGLLHEVHDSKMELLVTKRGRPVAKVVPVPETDGRPRIAGDCAGKARILGEIVETDRSSDWESLTPEP